MSPAMLLPVVSAAALAPPPAADSLRRGPLALSEAFSSQITASLGTVAGLFLKEV